MFIIFFSNKKIKTAFKMYFSFTKLYILKYYVTSKFQPQLHSYCFYMLITPVNSILARLVDDV